MVNPTEVILEPLAIERFGGLLDRTQMREALEIAKRACVLMQGRVLWNVNTTGVGGGVAEMLQSLLRYTRGVGIDTRWIVIDGNPGFFKLTKRLHHALHGSPGDGSRLDAAAREIYERTLSANGIEIATRVRADDVVLLHDPQTAGLGRQLIEAGAHVVWRCHIGHDTPNDEVLSGWKFLAPYLDPIPTFVFSRNAYIPEFCDHGKSNVIQPSIDAFSPKNCNLDEATVRSILVHTGLVEGPPPEPPQNVFLHEDGTPGRVEHQADVVRLGRAPTWDTPLVVQVSRWDPLKDFVGVMGAFALLCERHVAVDAHLVLAGPNVTAVADDPEGGQVFDQVVAQWRALPHAIRGRVHLASLPTKDVAENAVIVNALQRHAAIVVQKSLHEGFGLTVTEAMWKGRPVVASAVGGIQDQIEDGVSGILLKDPRDLEALADVLDGLLRDPAEAERLGAAARERVRDRFLGLRHLTQYAQLLEDVLR
jgi:trehalose synthase